MRIPLPKFYDYQPRQIRLLAWVIFTLLMLGTFTTWKRSIEFLNGRVRRESEETSREAISHLTTFFDERLLTLRRISQFCLATEGVPVAIPASRPGELPLDPRQRSFEAFCQSMLDEIPGFLAIIRTDHEGQPQWIAPPRRLTLETANLLAADPILMNGFRQSQINPFVSDPMTLIGHGEGFIIAVPILRGHRIHGYILGVFPYQGLFDNLIRPETRHEFNVRIKHGNRVVFPLMPHNSPRWDELGYTPLSEGYLIQQPLLVGDWLVMVEPAPERQPVPLKLISALILGLGALLSFLVSYAVYRWSLRAAQLQNEARESRSRLEHTGMSLIEARSQLELIINSVDEGIIIYDSNRKPIMANMAFQSMFNMGQASQLMNNAAGHHQRMIQLLGSESRYWSLFEALRRWPEQQYTDEVLPPFREGKRKPRAYTRRAMTVTDAAGEQRGIIIVYKDVTRDKALERTKDEFLANVTHELRSPLASIKGFAEMMRRDPDMAGERRNEFVSIICEEATRLQDLVEELLDLRRLEDQGMPFNPIVFDLRLLVEELIAGARAIMVSKNLAIELEWTGTSDHRVQGDIVQMRRAIRNLLVNSAKYSPEGCQIKIVGHSGIERLTLDIRDQGSGIDDRDLPHIFDKFYRGRRQGKQKGTGLGLAIVKHIVDRHGGHIGVRSEMGEGTTFRIELPRQLIAPVDDGDGSTPAPHDSASQ